MFYGRWIDSDSGVTTFPLCLGILKFPRMWRHRGLGDGRVQRGQASHTDVTASPPETGQQCPQMLHVSSDDNFSVFTLVIKQFI